MNVKSQSELDIDIGWTWNLSNLCLFLIKEDIFFYVILITFGGENVWILFWEDLDKPIQVQSYKSRDLGNP